MAVKLTAFLRAFDAAELILQPNKNLSLNMGTTVAVVEYSTSGDANLCWKSVSDHDNSKGA
jgi:hypothetical protein